MYEHDSPPKKPTKKLLEERFVLTGKAKAAGQEERRIKKAIAAIDEQLEAYVRQAEPRKKRLTVNGWLLSIAKTKKRPSWKGELLRVLGVDRVRDLEENAEEVERFTVEKSSA